MSNWLKGLSRLLPIGRNKPVGYDLQGNRYYEIPSLMSERPRRTIEYKIKKEPNDYVVGERMPVQWAAWLSHTRSHPPSLEELQADVNRRTRLAVNVAQIEARDAAESEARRLRALSSGEEVKRVEGGAGSSAGYHEVGSTQSSTGTSEQGKIDSSEYISPEERDPRDPNAATSPTLRQLSQHKMAEQRQQLEKTTRASGSAVFGILPDGGLKERKEAPGLFDGFVPLPRGRAGEAGRPARQTGPSSSPSSESKAPSTAPSAQSPSTQNQRSAGPTPGSAFAQPGQQVSDPAAAESTTVKPRARGGRGKVA